MTTAGRITENAVGQLVVLGALAVGGYYLYQYLRDNLLKPVTPGALSLYMDSSLGDMTTWYLGTFYADPLTQQEAQRRGYDVQRYFDNGGLGSL